MQRSLKFAKYLPEFGWKPLVIANGGHASDGVTQMKDDTLLRDLRADSIVRYTNDETKLQNKFRRWLNPTDTCAWWTKPAVETARQLLREHSPSAILVTMSPFTAAEAGIQLKQETNLPLILDLRDPWALDETKIYPTALHAWRDMAAMSRALRHADLIIMNTPQSAQAVRDAFNLSDSTAIISLTNGFDEDDFAKTTAQVPPADADTLRIVHTGLFHCELARIWDDLLDKKGLINQFKYPRRPINLWTRTPRYLLDAMQRATGKFELVLVGELTPADKAMLENSPIPDRAKIGPIPIKKGISPISSIKILGYRSHDESVAWLKSADLLFLPNHTPLDGEAALIVPGKTYEYLGARRPILAMGPPGDMRNFIHDTNSGVVLDGDDVSATAEALNQFHRAKLAGQSLYHADLEQISRFERRNLSQQLANELDKLTAAVPHRSAAPLPHRGALATQP